MMFRSEKLEKLTHKKACRKLKANLVAPMNQAEQDELLGYLSQQSVDPTSRIWLGFNDGIVNGKYVLDNTKGAVLMPWDNFRVENNLNTEEAGSIVMEYQTGDWIRVDAFHNDTAVCSKALPSN